MLCPLVPRLIRSPCVCVLCAQSAHMTVDISGKEVDEMLNEKVLGKRLHLSTAAHKPTHYNFGSDSAKGTNGAPTRLTNQPTLGARSSLSCTGVCSLWCVCPIVRIGFACLCPLLRTEARRIGASRSARVRAATRGARARAAVEAGRALWLVCRCALDRVSDPCCCCCWGLRCVPVLQVRRRRTTTSRIKQRETDDTARRPLCWLLQRERRSLSSR